MQRNHISWVRMSSQLCLGFGNWRSHKMQLNPLIGAVYDRNILQRLKQNEQAYYRDGTNFTELHRKLNIYNIFAVKRL